ncbi:hypothetical protein C5E07_11505 [Pseudoclavibacter sp. RFBJ3]|nr:hypothetical protein C5C12_10580 [Pseudoclavibacter sp. RFBJ5]PPF91716.1 hypothetical protein C5E07_11505 [Pseudoclavibacter sp. RFBJ3]PPF95533.1 hypothetical protein C5C19_17465 [Pseudoclavibacter sp. RFBH5]
MTVQAVWCLMMWWFLQKSLRFQVAVVPPYWWSMVWSSSQFVAGWRQPMKRQWMSRAFRKARMAAVGV